MYELCFLPEPFKRLGRRLFSFASQPVTLEKPIPNPYPTAPSSNPVYAARLVTPYRESRERTGRILPSSLMERLAKRRGRVRSVRRSPAMSPNLIGRIPIKYRKGRCLPAKRRECDRMYTATWINVTASDIFGIRQPALTVSTVPNSSPVPCDHPESVCRVVVSTRRTP